MLFRSKNTLLSLLEKVNANWEVCYHCEEEDLHDRHPRHSHGRHPEHPHDHGEDRRECDRNCQECEHPCRRGEHHHGHGHKTHYEENEG